MPYDTPYGSPLDPMRRPALGQGGPAPLAPLPAAPVVQPALQQPPAAPQGALSPQLPQAPPSKPKINMFDRQHIAQMLAQIGKGFGGAHSFGEGLSRSAGGIADMVMAENKPDPSEIGGPDNAFEIVTHRDGTREYRPIAEVQSYLTGKADRERKLKDAPKPSDSESWLGDTAYAVEQLPEAQRPGAWQLMLQQGHALGYDVSNAPPEYSPSFSKVAISRNIGARQGSANAATASYRSAVDADRDASRGITERRVNASIANAQAANARAAAKVRSSPPSTRKSKHSDLDYLR